jgi:hypothetical protein
MFGARVSLVVRSVLVAAVAGTVIALASLAHATAPSDLIVSGTVLEPGQTLKSPNGQYTLDMQTNGDLVVYWMNGTAIGRALWSTGTSGDNGARALLQSNGNLVLYSVTGEALWSSNTSTGGCSNLVIQNDGNLVVYNKTHATWAAGSIQHDLVSGEQMYPGDVLYAPYERYDVTMQSDGNFVLYGPLGAMWSTETNGILGSHVIMRSNGDLVVVSNGGRDLWISHTYTDPGAYATPQSDGNFVVYYKGKAVWDTGTGGHKPATGPDRDPRPAFVACPPPPTTTTTTTTTTAAPPPPPKKPDPVVLVPTRTKLPRLRVRIVMHWTWDYGVTHLHRITVPHMPRNATFAIKCKGKGCRQRAQVGSRRLRRLIGRLDGRAYRAGDRIVITITERRHKPERIEIEIRYGRSPRARLL